MTAPHQVRVGALLAGKCPRCGDGDIFYSWFSGRPPSMHEACSACGLDYEPDPGYFVGAMYASYAFGVFTVIPVAMALVLFFEASIALTLVIAAIQTLVMAPFVYRASRVLWLHIDQAMTGR
jgi:uncharacterized protein (DUF983 family)